MPRGRNIVEQIEFQKNITKCVRRILQEQYVHCSFAQN